MSSKSVQYLYEAKNVDDGTGHRERGHSLHSVNIIASAAHSLVEALQSNPMRSKNNCPISGSRSDGITN